LPAHAVNDEQTQAGGAVDAYIHADDAAARAAANIQARAFTIGAHIFFGRGEYTPATGRGERLLAHELMHVLDARPGGEISPVARRQPTGAGGREPEPAQAESYPRELDVIREALSAARKGRLAKNAGLGKPEPPYLIGLGKDSFIYGPLTSDLGPLYYVYRFTGRDEKHAYLVTRTAVVPKDWSALPTPQELQSARGGQTLHVPEMGPVTSRYKSKQTLWEEEFRRDNPELEGVGGGGEPWGATDEGEMTETGVRVPLAVGHTLLRRPFYESRDAAFFAYQGFIHYAELIEAGHGPAALNLAQALYSKTGQPIPFDKDLDLWEYTHWSRKAATARQGVEFATMLGELAVTIRSLIPGEFPALEPDVPSAAPTSSRVAAPGTSPGAATSTPGTGTLGAARVQITERAQAIVNQANAAVERAIRNGDQAFFQGLGMTPGQVRSVLNPQGKTFVAEYGNAVELEAARGFTQDPLLSRSIRYISRQRGWVAGSGKPDFVISEDAWGAQQFLDVTTPGSRQQHILRDYGKRVLQILYNRPAFP
jgi:hypothetical protein